MNEKNDRYSLFLLQIKENYTLVIISANIFYSANPKLNPNISLC